MKRYFTTVIASILLISMLLTGCGKKKEDDTVSAAVIKGKATIELQGFYVDIPKGYVATGGHDGIKYVNVVATPDKKNPDYEIEVGYGMGFISDDFEGMMYVASHDFESAAAALDYSKTKKWKTPCSAFTLTKTMQPFSSYFIEYQPEKGPSQLLIMYRDYKYIALELRALKGDVSDYDGVLAEFASEAIDWTD